jgi:hypothetical protein
MGWNKREGRSFRAAIGLTATAIGALAVWCGCGGDARLAGHKIRSATVRSVTHYGVTLDQQATPEQVAFVVLRAIRDDVSAKTKEEREAALDKQFDLCAANVLQKKNRTSMPRDEFIHSVVYHWAPTVSHYVGDFETEWGKAAARLVRAKSNTDLKANADETEVYMELADPNGDPKARVVMVIWMVQDEGFWRVTHVGFDPTKRSVGNKGMSNGE